MRFYNARKGRDNQKALSAKDVLDWMSELDCSNRDSIVIKNLFDRRNNNGISHAGVGDHIYEEVDDGEYNEFLKSAECLFHIALDKIV